MKKIIIGLNSALFICLVNCTFILLLIIYEDRLYSVSPYETLGDTFIQIFSLLAFVLAVLFITSCVQTIKESKKS